MDTEMTIRQSVLFAAAVTFIAMPAIGDQTAQSANGQFPDGKSDSWTREIDFSKIGGWELIGPTSDGKSVFFATRHLAQRDGDVVILWFRQEREESREDERLFGHKTWRSNAAQQAFNCKTKERRMVSLISYAEPNLKGSSYSMTFDPTENGWEPVVPGSGQERQLAWACKTIGRAAPDSGSKPKAAQPPTQ